MGIDCVTAEEFYLKYGVEGLFSREDLFQYLFFLQQSPTWDLGNIVWICDLMLGTTAHVMIWDARGPSSCHGQFFDFEMGAPDGTYKGCIHTAVPYIGRKKLSDDQQEYNDVHGFYRARVKHLFARFWHWKIVRNLWMGSATDLH